MKKQKSILVVVLNQGEIRTELVNTLLRLPFQGKYELFFSFPSDKPISYNRNKIVKNFLKSGCDYLLMIDSDIVPPLDVLDLADFQKDIIVPLMFAFAKDSYIPLILRFNDDGEHNPIKLTGEEGLVECDAVGTGCMFLSRRILAHPKMKAPFLNIYDQEGMKIRGLDLEFCRRAKELGFKVYAHTEYTCKHIVSMDLAMNYAALLAADENKKVAIKDINIKKLIR